MFGYVRPFKPEMKVCEYELYEAVYCGVCRAVRRRYGAGAAAALSYDLAFLALMGIGVRGGAAGMVKKRCPLHPLTGRNCACGTEGGDDAAEKSLDYAADCHVILSFHKLTDDLADGGLLKKLRAAVLLPAVYMMYYRKAKKRRRGIAAAVSRAMKRQRAAEKSGSRSVDRLSEPTASAMRAIFSELGDYDPDGRELLGQLGYMLGRYIYICDALDDLADDARHGDANPFLPRGKNVKVDSELRGRAERKARIAAELTLGEMAEVYRSVPLNSMSAVTDNIIYLGLRQRFEETADRIKKER